MVKAPSWWRIIIVAKSRSTLPVMRICCMPFMCSIIMPCMPPACGASAAMAQVPESIATRIQDRRAVVFMCLYSFDARSIFALQAAPLEGLPGTLAEAA